MDRTLQPALLAWKSRERRLPLIIQGARQVGKTYLMRWLGSTQYRQYAYFNFEERPELKEFFEGNKDVERILEMLGLVSGFPIRSDTLVVFDEIQECPQALNALKYFAERRPDIPVICAGSLLGIMLNHGHAFPVGKVEFLTLHPMTFREVLACWDGGLAKVLEDVDGLEPLPQYFFSEAVVQFKKYLVTGGLPAVVDAFNRSGAFEEGEQVLENLIRSYRADFAKHPVMSDVAKISQVFDSLPAQLARENRKFVYQLVRSGARAREYEDAIRWLVDAGLVHRVRRLTKPGLPLPAYLDDSAFKLYAFDVGVLRRLSRLSARAFGEGNRLFTEFKGAMTENYILQSLVAGLEAVPSYWTSGNSAEVDFILSFDDHIIPVEVKSDEHVRSRSLMLYHQTFAPPLRIRYSLRNISFREGLLNLPHFMADHTPRFIRRALSLAGAS
jgi:predicted AAA+ superfamily ATPase